MRVTVYTPRKLEIKDSDVPALTEKARKRHRLPEGSSVPVRHIIEEARRAGVIELGRDYCLDLEDDTLNGVARSGRRGAADAAATGRKRQEPEEARGRRDTIRPQTVRGGAEK